MCYSLVCASGSIDIVQCTKHSLNSKIQDIAQRYLTTVLIVLLIKIGDYRRYLQTVLPEQDFPQIQTFFVHPCCRLSCDKGRVWGMARFDWIERISRCTSYLHHTQDFLTNEGKKYMEQITSGFEIQLFSKLVYKIII